MEKKQNRINPNQKQPLGPKCRSKPNLGWQASISHPVKVNPSPPPSITKVLSNNIDTLHLSIDVTWNSELFFEYLAARQEEAKLQDEPVPVEIISPANEDLIDDEDDSLPLFIRPYGLRGYQWVLVGREYSFHIGNWMEPKTRPSVRVEIRSETLWHVGGKSAVGRVICLLSAVGAEIHTVKPSRVDMCVDMQLPAEIWDPILVNYRVTPSKKSAVHIDNFEFEGMDLGKGDMKARLYDKPREIKQKGQKDWMYDVWGMKDVAPDTYVIRIEFQIKRSVLRDLGIDLIFDLWMAEKELWAYCTAKWLKFSTNPGMHHTSRKTFDWWKMVQTAYQDEQPARPLIRCKALSTEQEKHFAQAFGSFTSLAAVIAELLKDVGPMDMTFTEAIHQFKSMAMVGNKTGPTFLDIIDDKRKKFCREKLKIQVTKAKREALGMPDNLSPVQPEQGNYKPVTSDKGQV